MTATEIGISCSFTAPESNTVAWQNNGSVFLLFFRDTLQSLKD